jgi:hypothetical protein
VPRLAKRILTFSVASLVLMPVGCSDDPPASSAGVCAVYESHPGADACRDQSDCKTGSCMRWNYVPSCPYPPQCSGDGSCSADQVCASDGCWVSCVSKCTPESCTGENGVCGADGHCQPTPCDAGHDCGADADCAPTDPGADGHGCRPHSCTTDGYSCPPNSRCDATSPDAHGCTVLTCSVDSECDCGVCWSGFCAAGPGYCGTVPS